MESIIRTIVDMDKRARERTAADEAYFEQMDSEASERAEQIRREEQDKAHKKIEQYQQLTKQKLEAATEDMKVKSEDISQKLSSLYAQKGSEWVDELVRRTIEG